MTVHELSRLDARRIAVRAQLLDGPRPTDLLAVVRRLTLLQIDPTAAIAPSADLVAWSRLGSSYSPAELAEALEDRMLVEFRATIRPSEDVALYRAQMAEWPERGQLRDWQKYRRDWVRRLRPLGIARARGPEAPGEPVDVGEAGEPAVVEGVKGAWRVDPEQVAQPFTGRAALLSPFDRLIHDRKRTIELFEFDYQLEMYKPAAKRRWGYFALPILWGDRLVGKLDATADRTAGLLRVNAIHPDAAFNKTMTAAVNGEIADLAHWLELDLTLAD